MDSSASFSRASAWAWARKGRTLRLLVRYDEALASYDRALELNSRFAWAWTGKGQVLERLGQLTEAGSICSSQALAFARQRGL